VSVPAEIYRDYNLCVALGEGKGRERKGREGKGKETILNVVLLTFICIIYYYK
jgi:hypothetical protein